MTFINDPRIDRLFQLLPAIYRIRDAEQDHELQTLLRVIAEQVNVVEDDIRQLYENWFIETAQEWVVPYIADLIGYRAAPGAGAPSDATTAEGRELNRVLIPRREVANTIGYRRAKGRLSLLPQLAWDVAGWPARAVEFFKLLGWNQNLNHLHLDRARNVDVRQMPALDLAGGPFDPLTHTVDVRRIDSNRIQGRYNIPSVGVFVWRLQPYKVTNTDAGCEVVRQPQYTFSILGQDAPLFTNPEPRTSDCAPDQQANFPSPITRIAFHDDKERFYGKDRSFAIWAEGWANLGPDEPVPADCIIPADLSDWHYVPLRNQVAVDTVLGRFAFPPLQVPGKVRVTYHYGFSANIGGGEYDRPILDPATRKVAGFGAEIMFYKVGRDGPFHRIGDALEHWQKDNPHDAVIELTDNSIHVEPISIELRAHQSLQLRAANGARPVIRLLSQSYPPDTFSVRMGSGSRLTLDGLLITGQPVEVTGPGSSDEQGPPESCGAELVIRHCTLVPGWEIDCDCEPEHPAHPSLDCSQLRARVRIEHSILGFIQVAEDEVNSDPIEIRISDSILDSGEPESQAIGGPGSTAAFAVLTMQRCTVFGIVDTHAIELAENTIFNNCLNAVRRQLGCMRFCYVLPNCRTPRRYHCQPDLVIEAVRESIQDTIQEKVGIEAETLRVQPQFTSVRYGNPGYAQMASGCAQEIRRGADDESEMGVFHDLFQPQREANLRARLSEYTPGGMDAGIIFVS
ncbi:MAG: hypothetical protein LAO78_13210 [Acidobacteriia bacterium]|nr:hypothetical protein [Terriglobia bacterium]